ncbi:WhiB family transcriptional regulator [Rudaeicoccus suwonensis]|uniref:Transcriptional regulator WhiB n=1 Tax=Rudaeicoccus suwonensis TaxID=657409 RepID=A0A561E1B3_9MICO|nr:WhiB family transcriptional regulator [Rudaeicoccus suwonensis]TWE09371.1 WhiB family redox-sensing transcriptional regulator [Rudaeicoccus suwonensis]
MTCVSSDKPVWNDNWVASAACRKAFGTANLFGSGPEQRKAKSICRRCTVVAECLADALDSRIEHGVWGGMTERERRALLRRRPDVVTWAELFKRDRPTGVIE